MVAAQAASRGGRVSAADVCAAAVAAVEVTGAWLSAAGGAEAGHLMRVTDEVSEQLAELQLTLGEGPSRGCVRLRRAGAGLGPGRRRVRLRRWPAFAPAACQAGAAAIFAFPLRIGAIRAGVMGLYRERPGPLSAVQLGDALIFADTATLLLLDSQDQAAGDPRRRPARAASRRTWPCTAPRSIRPPACSPSSSASASRRPLSGCAPTLMLMTGGWPTWPATSWRAACGCALTQTHPRTARRERLCHRQPRTACRAPGGSCCLS